MRSAALAIAAAIDVFRLWREGRAAEKAAARVCVGLIASAGGSRRRKA